MHPRVIPFALFTGVVVALAIPSTGQAATPATGCKLTVSAPQWIKRGELKGQFSFLRARAACRTFTRRAFQTDLVWTTADGREVVENRALGVPNARSWAIADTSSTSCFTPPVTWPHHDAPAGAPIRVAVRVSIKRVKGFGGRSGGVDPDRTRAGRAFKVATSRSVRFSALCSSQEIEDWQRQADEWRTLHPDDGSKSRASRARAS